MTWQNYASIDTDHYSEQKSMSLNSLIYFSFTNFPTRLKTRSLPKHRTWNVSWTIDCFYCFHGSIIKVICHFCYIKKKPWRSSHPQKKNEQKDTGTFSVRLKFNKSVTRSKKENKQQQVTRAEHVFRMLNLVWNFFPLLPFRGWLPSYKCALWFCLKIYFKLSRYFRRTHTSLPTFRKNNFVSLQFYSGDDDLRQ